MPSAKLALVTVLAALVLPAAPAAAQDPTNVPQGVSAAGVDLSGLTLEQATARLQEQLAARFQRNVVLGVAGRVYELTPDEAQFQFDALTTAKRALRNGGPGVVALKLTFSKKAVETFAAEVNKELYRAPRDARLKIGLRKMQIRRARHGRAIPQTQVVDEVVTALADENAPRALRTQLVKVSPKLSVEGLRRANSTVITIDKRNFKLRLFKRLKFVKSYGIAHGQPAYPTPSGLFRIANKQVNPVWSVPNSPWAGELAGTTVAGGSAANPLKARWMGIINGVGIHGTGQEYTIGSRASHGCIRMRVRDVIDLYPRVPVGTRVLIR